MNLPDTSALQNYSFKDKLPDMPKDLSYLKDYLDKLPSIAEISDKLPCETTLAAIAVGGGFIEWAAKLDNFYKKDMSEQDKKKSQAVELLGNTTRNVAGLALLIKAWPKIECKIKEVTQKK